MRIAAIKRWSPPIARAITYGDGEGGSALNRVQIAVATGSSPSTRQSPKVSAGSTKKTSGKRILTNAHVIADQRFVQVKRAGEVKKYLAEVDFVAHDCDLAVLRVSDDSFFTGAEPIATLKRVPPTSWLRLSHANEGRDTVCLLVADAPIARSPRGVSVRLSADGRWSGPTAPRRRLDGLCVQAVVTSARHTARASLEL